MSAAVTVFTIGYEGWGFDTWADELDALLVLARSQQVALMCWEEDPRRCHRSLAAAALQDRAGEPLSVIDIRRIPS